MATAPSPEAVPEGPSPEASLSDQDRIFYGKLDPEFSAAVLRARAKLKAQGWDLGPVGYDLSGARTPAEQKLARELYPGKAAPVGRSPHERHIAMDAMVHWEGQGAHRTANPADPEIAAVLQSENILTGVRGDEPWHIQWGGNAAPTGASPPAAPSGEAAADELAFDEVRKRRTALLHEGQSDRQEAFDIVRERRARQMGQIEEKVQNELYPPPSQPTALQQQAEGMAHVSPFDLPLRLPPPHPLPAPPSESGPPADVAPPAGLVDKKNYRPLLDRVLQRGQWLQRHKAALEQLDTEIAWADQHYQNNLDPAGETRLLEKREKRRRLTADYNAAVKIQNQEYGQFKAAPAPHFPALHYPGAVPPLPEERQLSELDRLVSAGPMRRMMAGQAQPVTPQQQSDLLSAEQVNQQVYQQRQRELTMALGRKLPPLIAAYNKEAAVLGRYGKTLADWRTLAKRGAFGLNVDAPYHEALQQYQEAYRQHTARGQSLERLQQRVVHLNKVANGPPVHAGMRYPGEPELPPTVDPSRGLLDEPLTWLGDLKVPLAGELRGWNPLYNSTTGYGQARQQILNRMKIDGTYPILPPLPTGRGAPEMARAIQEKNELLGALAEFVNTPQDERLLAKMFPARLGEAARFGPETAARRAAVALHHPLSPWQKQLLPVLVKQVQAEAAASVGANYVARLGIDAAVWYGAGAVGKWAHSFTTPLISKLLKPGLLETAFPTTLREALAGKAIRLTSEVGGRLQGGIMGGVAAQAIGTPLVTGLEGHGRLATPEELLHGARIGGLATAAHAAGEAGWNRTVDAVRGTMQLPYDAHVTPETVKGIAARIAGNEGMPRLIQRDLEAALTKMVRAPFSDKARWKDYVLKGIKQWRAMQAPGSDPLLSHLAPSRRLPVFGTPKEAGPLTVAHFLGTPKDAGPPSVIHPAPPSPVREGPIGPNGTLVLRQNGTATDTRLMDENELAQAHAEASAAGDKLSAQTAAAALAHRSAWGSGAVSLPQGQAPQFQAEWQAPGNAARRASESLSRGADREEKANPTLAALLRGAADEYRQEFGKSFGAGVTGDDLPALVPPRAAHYRFLSEEERTHLPVDLKRPLLVLDINNSRRALEPGRPFDFEVKGGVPQLTRLADQLYEQAGERLNGTPEVDPLITAAHVVTTTGRTTRGQFQEATGAGAQQAQSLLQELVRRGVLNPPDASGVYTARMGADEAAGALMAPSEGMGLLPPPGGGGELPPGQAGRPEGPPGTIRPSPMREEEAPPHQRERGPRPPVGTPPEEGGRAGRGPIVAAPAPEPPAPAPAAVTAPPPPATAAVAAPAAKASTVAPREVPPARTDGLDLSRSYRRNNGAEVRLRQEGDQVWMRYTRAGKGTTPVGAERLMGDPEAFLAVWKPVGGKAAEVPPPQQTAAETPPAPASQPQPAPAPEPVAAEATKPPVETTAAPAETAAAIAAPTAKAGDEALTPPEAPAPEAPPPAEKRAIGTFTSATTGETVPPPTAWAPVREGKGPARVEPLVGTREQIKKGTVWTNPDTGAEVIISRSALATNKKVYFEVQAAGSSLVLPDRPGSPFDLPIEDFLADYRLRPGERQGSKGGETPPGFRRGSVGWPTGDQGEEGSLEQGMKGGESPPEGEVGSGGEDDPALEAYRAITGHQVPPLLPSQLSETNSLFENGPARWSNIDNLRRNPPTWLQKFHEGWRQSAGEAKRFFTDYEDKLPRGPEFAAMARALRKLRDGMTLAQGEMNLRLRSTFASADLKDPNIRYILAQGLVARDLKGWMMSQEKQEGRPLTDEELTLPDYLGRDRIEAALSRLEEVGQRYPGALKALDDYSAMQKELFHWEKRLARELFAIDLGDGHEHYYPHHILKYEGEMQLKGASGAIRGSFTRERHRPRMSQEEYEQDFLKVLPVSIAQTLFDIHRLEALKLARDLHDHMPFFTLGTLMANDRLTADWVRGEGQQSVARAGTDPEQARNLYKLARQARLGNIPAGPGSRFMPLVTELLQYADSYEHAGGRHGGLLLTPEALPPTLTPESQALFGEFGRYLERLPSGTSGRPQALKMLGGIASFAARGKAVLGDREVTVPELVRQTGGRFDIYDPLEWMSKRKVTTGERGALMQDLPTITPAYVEGAEQLMNHWSDILKNAKTDIRMVLPAELSRALEEFKPPRSVTDADLPQVWNSRLTGLWKSYQLMSLPHFLGYQLRNTLGDVQATLMANPRAAYYQIAPWAWKRTVAPVWRLFTLPDPHGDLGKFDPARRETDAALVRFMRETGFVGHFAAAEKVGPSGQITATGLPTRVIEPEVGPIRKLVQDVGEVGWEAAKAIGGRSRGIRNLSDLREIQQRFTHFLTYEDSIRADLARGGEGIPHNFGASDWREVMAQPLDSEHPEAGIAARAAMLAQEVMLDYGQISRAGIAIRKISPFYGFTDRNLARQIQLVRNAVADPKTVVRIAEATEATNIKPSLQEIIHELPLSPPPPGFSRWHPDDQKAWRNQQDRLYVQAVAEALTDASAFHEQFQKTAKLPLGLYFFGHLGRMLGWGAAGVGAGMALQARQPYDQNLDERARREIHLSLPVPFSGGQQTAALSRFDVMQDLASNPVTPLGYLGLEDIWGLAAEGSLRNSYWRELQKKVRVDRAADDMWHQFVDFARDYVKQTPDAQRIWRDQFSRAGIKAKAWERITEIVTGRGPISRFEEMAYQRSLWPDLTDPREIRDVYLQLARSMGFQSLYEDMQALVAWKRAQGLLHPREESGVVGALQAAFSPETDLTAGLTEYQKQRLGPQFFRAQTTARARLAGAALRYAGLHIAARGQGQLQDAQEWSRRYLREVVGQAPERGGYSPRSNAFFHYRKALLAGEVNAALYYMMVYIGTHKATPDQTLTAVHNQAPLAILESEPNPKQLLTDRALKQKYPAGLAHPRLVNFVEQLTPWEVRRMISAYDYYSQVYGLGMESTDRKLAKFKDDPQRLLLALHFELVGHGGEDKGQVGRVYERTAAVVGKMPAAKQLGKEADREQKAAQDEARDRVESRIKEVQEK